MGRIIYISTRNTAPSGGVKVLFQHVAALRELGFDAAIGHPVDGFEPDWFASDVPIIYYLKGLRVTPDDVVVILETGKNTMRLFRDASCRKVIFCQNQFGIITSKNMLCVPAERKTTINGARPVTGENDHPNHWPLKGAQPGAD